MKLNILFQSFYISNLVVLINFNEFTNGKPYKAGVVEYFYNLFDTSNLEKTLDENLNQFLKIIAEFKKTWRSDVEDGILVFPEYGLLRDASTTSFFIPVPEPDYNSESFTDNKILWTISKAAKTHKIWVVVNLLEAFQDKKYNTNVVFRSNGTIAAKYRKYNLFGEDLDRPDIPDAVSFTTDFGVTFGIFTCFDILFPRPALDLFKEGIKHFVFPTAWISELPFLTAIQYQMSWAWSNNVTLLGSGLGFTDVGSTGSGIYQGKKGSVIHYQTYNSNETKLIAAVLDTDDQANDKHPDCIVKQVEKTSLQMNGKQLETTDTKQSLKLLQEPLSTYTTELITHHGCKMDNGLIPGHVTDCVKQVKKSVCNGELCCEFNLTAIFNVYICFDDKCQGLSDYLPATYPPDDFSLSKHRLAAFDGLRSFQVTNAGLQICGIISCKNNYANSCGLPPQIQKPTCFHLEELRICILRRFIPKVEIKGNFKKGNVLVTPNILLGEKNASSFEFGQLSNDFKLSHDENGEATMSFKTRSKYTPLSTVAIWSRIYDKDEETVTPNSSTFLNHRAHTLINALKSTLLL